jgi:tetratricopeptide (TPR) repeat protein
MNERIEKIKAFLIQNPNDLFLNHALALEFIKLELDKEALIHFNKNKAFDPNYVATYYHLGKLLERMGSSERAIATFEEGMRIAKEQKDQHAYNELQAAYEDLADF